MEQGADNEGCAESLRQLDYSRYLACLFAELKDRDTLMALHAFNAELGRIRESVSEPMLGEIRLTWWREAVEGLARGQVRSHPVIRSLCIPISEQRIDVAALLSMIEARIADVYEEAPKDEAALKHYAKETGGALMQQAVKAVGGSAGEQGIALSLGAAMTMGGVARSIAFHAAMRRVHLPAQELAAMGVTPEDLFQGEFTPAISALARRIGEGALATSRAALKEELPKRCRRALVPGIFAYDDLVWASRLGFDPQKQVRDASYAGKLAKSWWYCQTGRS